MAQNDGHESRRLVYGQNPFDYMAQHLVVAQPKHDIDAVGMRFEKEFAAPAGHPPESISVVRSLAQLRDIADEVQREHMRAHHLTPTGAMPNSWRVAGLCYDPGVTSFSAYFPRRDWPEVLLLYGHAIPDDFLPKGTALIFSAKKP